MRIFSCGTINISEAKVNGDRKRIGTDGVSALVLLIIALAICFGSMATLSYGTYHSPGPAFLPFWTGILIGAMALALLVQSIFQKTRLPQKLSSASLKKPGFALLALILYGLLFGVLGYFICNLLFMGFMVLLMEKKKWYTALGIGLVTALGFYVVFGIWLQVPLPRGILF